MTHTDRILLALMLTLIMARAAIVAPLDDWRGAVIAFAFGALAVAFSLRKGVGV